MGKSEAETPPINPTVNIALVYTTELTIVVFASFAAVIALCIQVPPVPLVQELPPVPVRFATPSVSKIILRAVWQSKCPLGGDKAISAFTIPS